MSAPAAPPAGVHERYVACLAEISTRLLQAADPLELLDWAVARLRAASGADRCYVLENRAHPGGAIRTSLRAESCAPGVEAFLGRSEAQDVPLVVLDRPELARGEPLFGAVAGFPAAARRVLEPQGVLNIALLPIQADGAWWGTLGLDACRPELRFGEADVALLRITANAIGAALERARKEAALAAGERRFRAIVDRAFDLIAELDAQGRFLYASPSHESVLGVAPGALIGSNPLERVHPDDRTEAVRIAREATPAGSAVAVLRLRHEDGSWRTLECTGRLFETPEGERRAVVIGRDLSERRRVEADRARLEQAMDQAGDAIVIWDSNGQVVFVNAVWERMMGVPRERALGGNILAFADESQTRSYTGEARGSLREKGTWHGRMHGKTGRIVDTSVAAVHDPSGRVQHYISVARDVTREVQLEDQIRRQQKLEAIGTLATGVAHDFNNLLTGVLGYAELLAQRRPTAEEVAEAARVIGDAARRGAELTSQLLGFGLQSRLRSEPVDVNETIADVVRLVSRTFPRSIAIRIVLGAPGATVLGDAGQLQQVFLNLALNARDAMPEGGELEIRTEHVAGEGRGRLAVHVRDTGYGIPAELRERVFEPFFTTRRAEKGTGMGLAVVDTIVRSHRGTIRLESEVGAGTHFVVELPLSPAARPVRAAPQDALVTGEGRVLVVDDEPAVRGVAARMLRRLGYDPREAAGGAEAIEQVRAEPRAFALVLLDLDMPGMNGRACLRALRELDPQLPVVLSTGLPTSELEDLRDAEHVGLLPKPYVLAQLSETVAAAIGDAKARRR
jgi:PAS domain S-box-containing protein